MSDAHVLHFFGGKGGVGKSTLAAAYALRLAAESPKARVLLLSLEGGHGLADVLKKKLGPKATRLTTGKGEGGVYAAEFDAAQALPAFREKLVTALERAAQKGTLLGEADLALLQGQASAGLEELVGLLGVLEQLEDQNWDKVVLDVAPTPHVLRLLDLPQHLKRLVAAPARASAQAPAAVAPAAPAAKGKKAAAKTASPATAAAPAAAGAPGVLTALAQQVDRLVALLKDPARTAFHLVALAEPVAEAQTRFLFNGLKERGVAVREIVVNQVEDREGCPACQGRRGLQAPHVRKFQALDKAVGVALLGRREEAPRGLEALEQLAREWEAGKETKALEFAAFEGPPALVRAPSMPPIAAPPLPPTRLIFFVGQGGVGKSSCAAAAAVTLTEKEGPVLLISTDPAHSLSDVLQSRLTDTETQVKGTKGLYARELDFAGWFNALRKKLRERADKALGPAPKGGEAQDLALVRNLLDTAPAGMDEFAALSVLTDALVQERFKRIVVDPTPSLGQVRLVEVAHAAKAWLAAVGQVLARYRAKGLGDLEAEVGALLKHVQRFEAALGSPQESRFVVVTRGEELANARTERLVDYLKERKLQVERVIVNRVLPKTTCDKCENRRKNELNAAKALEKKIGLPITVAPAVGRHPAGLRELKAFRTAWYALSATPKSVKAA